MKRIYLAAILTLAVVSACNKGTEPEYKQLAYFPNDVGNWWQYEVYDSLTQKTKLVNVSIHRDTVLSTGENATVWRYEDQQSNRTEMFVVVVGDSVKFYAPTTPETLESVFIIPFSVGNGWTFAELGGLGYDTLTVVEKTVVEVPLGKFDNSFTISSLLNSACMNCYEERTYWFQPQIGFLQFDFNSGWLIPSEVNETWQLTDIRRPMP